ncbi:thioredoxin family protein [Polaribacter sargassicola]|uniref:thioredoxin family protein n=1 Tax=Polaribacter sargassicola TaxID=2836891 RepID=UPI001F1F1BEA|nr:thioredoxin family protein [Polaribacter sp. DS7-9]MCG1037533.1 thioredoxin family protein [Polaribacter sp. DS7-9]
MKKTSLLIAVIFLTTSIFISCKKDNTKDQKTENIEKHQGPPNGDHNGRPAGPPPGEHGDRKGPPPGGAHSPEQTKTLEEIGGYKIGDVATDFNLKNVDGTQFSLSNIKNAKGYIVVFTCNECPFAKMYEDRLIAIHNEYAAKGYSVIAINPNYSGEEGKEGFIAMQERAKEKEFPFVYLADDGQKIFPQYGAVRTPHVFLLDADKKVQYIGTIDDNARSAKDVKVKYLENAIKALEKGEKPSPNFTKAIGCPVKAV